MPSRNEIINEYFKRIVKSKNKINEFDKILDEINNLVYEKTNKPISDESKKKLLKELLDRLEPFRKSIEYRSFDESIDTFSRRDRIFSAADNSEILDIISTIENKLKGK